MRDVNLLHFDQILIKKNNNLFGSGEPEICTVFVLIVVFNLLIIFFLTIRTSAGLIGNYSYPPLCCSVYLFKS